MRATKILADLVGIKGLVVEGFDVLSGMLRLKVRPRWKRPRCSRCGKKGVVHDVRQDRWWRHLDFGGVVVVLAYDIRRLKCRRCGVVVEKVPWSSQAESRFTTDFEDQVAYMAQRTDKSSVERLFNIAWRTVGTIVERVLSRIRPSLGTENLRAIGVDELSYRKQHHYVTLITDHGNRRVVWGTEGRSAESLKKFFDELGAEKCAKIEVVTMDMSGAFIKAVRDCLPNAEIVFDRFHVQRLASDALDATRRELWRALKGSTAGDAMKHTRWILLKSRNNLNQEELVRLEHLERANGDLYRGYLLKESLADILDRKQINVMGNELAAWIDDATKSGLPAFAKVAKTIADHFAGIIAYARHKLSNALAEGLNNKARLLTRRAYGFHSAQAVLAMIELYCGGFDLNPVRKLLAFS